MRLTRRMMLAGLAAVAVASLGLGDATALEKMKQQAEETIELFPALPSDEGYLPYELAPAPNGLPGPVIPSSRYHKYPSILDDEPRTIIYPTGYAPVGFDPSCCQIPVCEEVCPPKCGECPKVPYILSFCNPVTKCKEYVKVCIPACCEGCPKKSFRKTLFGYGVLTFSWCCGYEVKIKIRRHGKLVVRD